MSRENEPLQFPWPFVFLTLALMTDALITPTRDRLVIAFVCLFLSAWYIGRMMERRIAQGQRICAEYDDEQEAE